MKLKLQKVSTDGSLALCWDPKSRDFAANQTEACVLMDKEDAVDLYEALHEWLVQQTRNQINCMNEIIRERR